MNGLAVDLSGLASVNHRRVTEGARTPFPPQADRQRSNRELDRL